LRRILRFIVCQHNEKSGVFAVLSVDTEIMHIGKFSKPPSFFQTA